MQDFEKYCRKLKSSDLSSNVLWKGTFSYHDILDYFTYNALNKNNSYVIYVSNYSSLSNALFGLRKCNSSRCDIKYMYCLVIENDIQKGLFVYIQDLKSKELTFNKFYDLEKLKIFT